MSRVDFRRMTKDFLLGEAPDESPEMLTESVDKNDLYENFDIDSIKISGINILSESSKELLEETVQYYRNNFV